MKKKKSDNKKSEIENSQNSLKFGSHEPSQINKRILLIGLSLILIISLAIIISALTDDERASLQSELDSLENELSNNGYNWLINQSIDYNSINESSQTANIEVFRKNGNETIAVIENITTADYYKTYLSGLGENETSDTFDLKVSQVSGLGRDMGLGIEFDEIVDPIDILTIQSYPTVGGNWTVEFNTTGNEKLTIKAVNGTVFGFNCYSPSEKIDLELLEVKCGNETRNLTIIINETEISYENYLKKRRLEKIKKILFQNFLSVQFLLTPILSEELNIKRLLE